MSADIDIDFFNRDAALSALRHVRASRSNTLAHNTGVYFQNIPQNPITGLSTIDYKLAEDRGYFKVDLLNVNIYQGVRDEEHLVSLMTKEPIWDLLQQTDFSNLLFHVSGHGFILRSMKPTSIEQLAAVLAMIRPAKKHLVGKPWPDVMAEVWVKPAGDEYYFKKSHAVAYATAVVVQMNLICEQLVNVLET